MSSSELSRRAQKILHAVVTEYLHAGEAVGSRTVTRRHDLKLSTQAITITNANRTSGGTPPSTSTPPQQDTGGGGGDEGGCGNDCR